MHKGREQAEFYCGIDVGAQELAVAVERAAGEPEQRVFSNTRGGHQTLVRWLQKADRTVRVCLEATGMYSLDLALALAAAEGIEVAVLNPKRMHRFASTLCRSKTDAADAVALAEYARRMPFQRWQPPSAAALELRAITRYAVQLVEQQGMQSSRLHAASASATVPACVRQDLRSSLRQLDRRIAKLRCQARLLVRQTPEFDRRFRLLLSVPGIAEVSALQLLGELMLLSPDLEVRQWVAHSGLDPQHHESGSSVHKKPRISRAGNRYLRRALFMPALVAARRDPHLRGFYLRLLERHKTKMQALIAVARKMLHAIFGMFRSRSAYDGQRLVPIKERFSPSPLSQEKLLAT
ncbi:MAG: IS110 family transposase [Terriglobales bacterium]